MARNPNTTCSKCGTPVYKRPFELERYHNIFCSRECRLGKPLKYKKCVYCSNTFKEGNRGQKYCSKVCSGKSRRGKTYSKSGYKNSTERRIAKLKESFNFSTCMIDGCSYSLTFDVHRFIPGRDGGKYEIGNMFAICPGHHAEITRNLAVVEQVSDHVLQLHYTS